MGIAGGSYGGAIALMAAAYDSRVDAIVPQITWYDLADALFPDATGQGPESGRVQAHVGGAVLQPGRLPRPAGGRRGTARRPGTAHGTGAARQPRGR